MTEPEMQSFSFLEMNFWKGRLWYPMKAMLERVKPDIMATQEMLSGPRSHVPDHCTAEDLIRNGLMSEMSLGNGVYWNTHRGDIRNTQSAIFAANATAMTGSTIVPVAEVDERDKDMWDAIYYSALHSVVDVNSTTNPAKETPVNVLTYHGRIEPGKRMGSETSDRDMAKIAKYIATLSGPTIFCGDLNLEAGASSLLPLKKLGMRNMIEEYGITAARNEFAWKSDEAVVHVFVSPDVTVDEFEVLQDNVSDHLPMLAQCRVPRPEPKAPRDHLGQLAR